MNTKIVRIPFLITMPGVNQSLLNSNVYAKAADTLLATKDQATRELDEALEAGYAILDKEIISSTSGDITQGFVQYILRRKEVQNITREQILSEVYQRVGTPLPRRSDAFSSANDPVVQPADALRETRLAVDPFSGVRSVGDRNLNVEPPTE